MSVQYENHWLCVQESLEQIQSVLNSTEVGLHQLTALVDCRSLHMVSHCLLCLMAEIRSALPSWRFFSPLLFFKGLCPGFDWAVLWWSRRSYLPGSVLLCHRSDVLFYCVQCATYLAKEEVSHTCSSKVPLMLVWDFSIGGLAHSAKKVWVN